jgi:SpoVK/Ycf46/Vps4 family AAA+-type ATPase
MVLSKYIGETEKNLEQIFAKAEDKGWILFFDEADSLFGKRTNVRDAHDKYANQEVSYLLQRIEDYNGIVILATNMKNNIVDAFMRRFNAILKFNIPEPDERVKIWRLAFPQDVQFYNNDQPADIPEMVKNYVLSGGSIINVVHYACIKAFERQQNKDTAKRIYYTDVLAGIKKELLKEGKPFG